MTGYARQQDKMRIEPRSRAAAIKMLGGMIPVMKGDLAAGKGDADSLRRLISSSEEMKGMLERDEVPAVAATFAQGIIDLATGKVVAGRGGGAEPTVELLATRRELTTAKLALATARAECDRLFTVAVAKGLNPAGLVAAGRPYAAKLETDRLFTAAADTAGGRMSEARRRELLSMDAIGRQILAGETGGEAAEADATSPARAEDPAPARAPGAMSDSRRAELLAVTSLGRLALAGA